MKNDVQVSDGKKAELRFKAMFEAAGVKVVDATEDENINKHIDYHLYALEAYTTVDVKCMKRVSREDPEPQDKFVWVEFMNVRGKPGWLYGEAQFIAFETKDGFAMVERIDLIDHCNQYVNKEINAYKPQDALNAVYRRERRRDSMTLLELELIPHTKIKGK
jgi:hypothetical protein